jgi:hypothetical protein
VWDRGTFYKWEDWPSWDRVNGPIMGGGGLGMRNGWAMGHHEGDPNTIQDEIRIIRERIVAAGCRGDGWHADDFAAEAPARLCASATGPTRTGVIERFGDEDSFWLDWAGGSAPTREREGRPYADPGGLSPGRGDSLLPATDGSPAATDGRPAATDGRPAATDGRPAATGHSSRSSSSALSTRPRSRS